jgi:V/A-type H+/Na+-transporting ATPase subunit C
MSGYDYGNARLRAMKSRLLSRHELAALAEVGSLNGLIAALTKTPYQRPLETALARTSGMNSIASAIRDDLVGSLGKVRSFYDEEAGEMVAIVLRAYDIHNLKAILRGLFRNARPDEILATLLPVGELKSGVLAELVRALEPRSAIDRLASLNSRFAQPLLELRSQHPGADVTRMELALEQWSFQEAQNTLGRQNQDDGILSRAIKMEADLANLSTVLRFAHTPAERKLVREWLGEEDLRQLLVGPGFLPFDLLVQAGMQDTLDAAVECFVGTAYEAPLRAGLKIYASSLRLSDLERQLRRFRLNWFAGQIVADPLGIGMVLGYCAIKVNEVSNLRWIAQGIQMRLSARDIRASLEFPS